MPTIQRTLKILDFIRRYLLSNGEAPTLREIAQQFQMSITSVHQHLVKMELKGWIKRSRKHRGIEIVEQERRAA